MRTPGQQPPTPGGGLGHLLGITPQGNPPPSAQGGNPFGQFGTTATPG